VRIARWEGDLDAALHLLDPDGNLHEGPADRLEFRRDDIDMSIFCFGKRGDAELFQARFGGEFIDAQSRPKWRSSR
jgi:hypothetical protein